MNKRSTDKPVNDVRKERRSYECGCSFEPLAYHGHTHLRTSDRACISANRERYRTSFSVGVITYGKKNKTGK